jgi:hypothetical protein
MCIHTTEHGSGLSIHNGIEWDPTKKGKVSQQTAAGAVLRGAETCLQVQPAKTNDEIEIQQMAFTLDDIDAVADR